MRSRARHGRTSRIAKRVFLCLLALSASFPAIGATSPIARQGAPQSEEPVPLLTRGAPIERDLSAAATHRYRIDLRSDEYALVTGWANEARMSIRLVDPRGNAVADSATDDLFLGVTKLHAVAGSDGEHLVEVRVTPGGTGAYRYRLSLDEQRPASSTDRARVAAERAFTDGLRLIAQRSGNALRSAAERMRDAVSLYRNAGDRRGEAAAHKHLGEIARLTNDVATALEHFGAARSIAHEIGDRNLLAAAHNGIGIASADRNDHDAAIESLTLAVSLFREIGDRSGEAIALNSFATVHHARGEYREALGYLQDALAIHRSRKDRNGEASALNNIAQMYVALGERQRALDTFGEALVAIRADGDPRGEAIVLNSTGGVYSTLGDYERALSLYNEALPLYRAAGNRGGEANVLNRIGRAHFFLGASERALAHYTEALAIVRAIKLAVGEASVLLNIGELHLARGDPQKALETLAPALATIRAAKNPRGEAFVLSLLGETYLALGNHAMAVGSLDASLVIHRALGDRSAEARALHHLARAHRAAGHLDLAIARNLEALATVETLRSALAADESRTSYFSTVRGVYETRIDLLMLAHDKDPSRGFDREALEASESARARGLLDLLAEAGAGIRQGVDVELLDRERALGGRLNLLAERYSRMRAGGAPPEQVERASTEVEAIASELRDVRARIRVSSPRYAALTQPEPLRVREIQERVLDPETVVLEYSLGDEHSYLWTVSRSAISSHRLPGRAEIEAAARRFYEAARDRTSEAEVADAAAALSRMLLVPAAGRLTHMRLVVVPDGILHYVPFAALPIPGGSAPGRVRPLVVDHEVIHLPSASVLAEMRAHLAGRKRAPKTVAVFADPVFGADDPRLGMSGKAAISADRPGPEALRRAARDVDGGSKPFERLPFSRREARSILTLAAKERSFEALDFAASRAAVTAVPLGEYRIVHFATHGLLDSRRPELSGLVLSLVDDRGDSIDGFLRLHDIYNLELPADLVVLSACRTGLGREVRGEGLVGLTRGFMYAGAERVVSSLWRVDDAATAELMKRFYGEMLGRGLRPAAALRAAQIEMLQQSRWKHPYYWGAFVLQGEWR